MAKYLSDKAKNKGPKIPVSALLAAVAAAALLTGCASPEEKVERYTASGAEYLEADQLGRASVQFKKALQIDEEHVPAIEGLVDIAEKRNDLRQMFSLLQRIARLDPSNVEAHVNLSKIYLLGSDETSALESVDAALALEPENPDALAAKAAIMFRLENRTEAVALAKRALALKPNSQEAATVIVTDLVNRNELDAALAELDRSLSIDPKAAVLHLLRVQILTRQGRTEDIRAAYEKLVVEFPEEAGFRRLYASRLIEEGDLPTAREQLLAVTEIASSEVEGFNDVVRLDYRIGGEELATKTFGGFLTERPDDIELKFAYAAFLREIGKSDDAKKVYAEIAGNSDKDEIANALRAKNELAAIALAGGDREGARKLIDEILAADARNSEGLIKQASFKLLDKQVDSAINDLRLVISDDPESATARLLLAAAYEQSGETAAAESEMSQAFEISGKKGNIANVFARFLLRHAKADRAERVLVDSLAVEAGDRENLKLLAALRLQNQDWRGAEEVAKRLDQTTESDGVVNRILGAAYSGLQDYAGAIDSLSRAVEAEPADTRPLAALVNAYMSSDRADDAERVLSDRIAEKPEDYDARILLSQVQSSQERLGESKETLRAAIDADPVRPAAYELLYRIYRSEQRNADAAAMLEQGLLAAPDNDGLKILRADLHLAEGEQDKALALYEDILSRRPDDVIAANNFAAILSDTTDDPAKLARAADVATVLAKAESAAFQDTYGWALYRAGKTEDGIAALKKSIALDPNLLDAQFHLGVALAEQGRLEEARPYLERLVNDAKSSAPQAARARELLARR